MKIKQLINNLQSTINEEWGVNANLKINIHSHNNNYNYEEAKEIAGKIADEFDSSCFEDENDGTHWIKMRDYNPEIIVYWDEEND